MSILSEVAVSRYFGRSKNKVRKLLIGFIGVCNLFMWGHSIADAVCRYEVDNSAIVGYQLWEFLDPLFGSAVVFFRILSSCLYLSLALHSQDAHAKPDDACSESNDHADSSMSQETKAKYLGRMEFMITCKNIREQTLTIYNNPGKPTNMFEYFAKSDRNRRNTTRSYYSAVIAIVFVAVPFVVYDALARHVGKKQESHLKYVVELFTNFLFILFCGWYVVYHGIMELFSLLKFRKIGCKDCFNLIVNFVRPSYHNVEFFVFLWFTLAAVVFYVTLATFKTGGDVAASLLGIVAVICHSTFIFCTTLVRCPLKLLWRGNAHHSSNTLVLTLLFATTLGSLAVDIEREHLDHDVHDKPFLRVLAPLLVDFRVHAAILTYSVLSEFLQQNLTEREVQDKKTFEKVEDHQTFGKVEDKKTVEYMKEFKSEDNSNLELKCFMPGCKTVYRHDVGVVFWKCTRAKNECPSGSYCSECFKEFVVKVGFCPTCGELPTPLHANNTLHTASTKENEVNDK